MIEIIVQLGFEKTDPDMRKCSACHEVIFSANNIMTVEVNNSKERTDIVFCNSCKNLYDEQTGTKKISD